MVAHVTLGAILGVVLLHPAAMIVAWMESDAPQLGLTEFIGRAWSSLALRVIGMPGMTATFAALGATIGVAFALYNRAVRAKDRTIDELTRELARNIDSVIASGEDDRVEFKSTARWDLHQGKLNRALEVVIAKTIAAFLNHEGGNLIIGIADDGTTVGIEHDYSTLKHKDRDGFLQFLMTLLAQRFGGDICALVHPTFARVNDKDVCRIVVEPAHRPVYMQEDAGVRYFLRTGNTSRELDVQEAVDHIALRWPDRAAASRSRPSVT